MVASIMKACSLVVFKYKPLLWYCAGKTEAKGGGGGGGGGATM